MCVDVCWVELSRSSGFVSEKDEEKEGKGTSTNRNKRQQASSKKFRVIAWLPSCLLPPPPRALFPSVCSFSGQTWPWVLGSSRLFLLVEGD